MRVALVVLLVTLPLAGCGDPTGSDGGVATDGAAMGDAATRDAEPGCDGRSILVDLGHCFSAQRCCVAADCGTDRVWDCNDEGLCEARDRTCGCADDLDCPEDAFCFTNAVVCGICMPAEPACISDVNCMGGRCSRGYCVDETMCLDYPDP